MRRLLHALTRPRALPGGARGGRRAGGRRSGVALLVVVTTMMVLTVLVTELSYGARVRYLVAAHQRDRVQAKWLALSGVNLYRLILAANKQLSSNEMLSQVSDMIGLNLGDALWQMIPVLNTGLIRMLLGSGGSVSDVDEEAMQEFERTGQVDEELAEKSKEATGVFADKNFLDFDGDFSAEVTDHESRINVNYFAKEGEVASLQESPTAMMLYQLMSGEENDQWFHDRNIDRWEIIGNLKDWVDSDSYRSGGLGGYEDNLYNRLDPPYLSKNAPFDTLEEIRLVAGWEGEVFDRFRDSLTVYGSSRKININTANDYVLDSIIRSCTATGAAPTTYEMQRCREDPRWLLVSGTFANAKDFVQTIGEVCGIELDSDCVKSSVTTSSKTFTIKSTGLVGTSSVTITATLDYSKSYKGDVLNWRID